jgi:hypothetical protein
MTKKYHQMSCLGGILASFKSIPENACPGNCVPYKKINKDIQNWPICKPILDFTLILQ